MRGTLRVAGALIAAAVVAAGAPEDAWKSWIDRGTAAETAGDYAGAAAAYREAAVLAEAFDRADARRVLTFNAQGTMYDALGRFADSEAAYRRALEALDLAEPGPSVNRAVLLGNLANVLFEMGHKGRAESLLRESLAIHAAVHPLDEHRRSMARNNLAEFLIVTGRFDEAAAQLEPTVAVLQDRPDARTEFGIALNNLGAVRLYQGRYAEGQALLERSLAVLEAAHGPAHPILLRTLHNLAAARQRNGQRRSAGDVWRRAVDLAATSLGLEHPLYGEILGSYAAYLRDTGDKAQGKALAARSARILGDHRRRNGIGAIVDITALQQR